MSGLRIKHGDRCITHTCGRFVYLPFAWNPLRRKMFTLRASVARIPPVCCTACVYKAVLVAPCVSAYASPEGLGRVGF